ncbi:hypothetical protein [Nocardia gamkensis]|uniref:Uncharacterized protein n=1 Tax=Nocardia gamkensis TaxID=352869 RepID=A0A7X6R658_9NOCA|nr:hypothetical protein [Nocardia gamkensis]NKY30295.1 hypothetical protein [Nocardia gamkensis]
MEYRPGDTEADNAHRQRCDQASHPGGRSRQPPQPHPARHPAGQRIAREAEQRRREAFAERFRDWDDEDLAELAGYLVRYNAADD